MATAIPELALSLDGGVLPAAVSDTDVYVRDNDGNVIIRAKNVSGSDVTITLVATASTAGHTVNGKTVVIPANNERWLKPLPPVVYNDDDVGDAHITDPSGALQFLGIRF